MLTQQLQFVPERDGETFAAVPAAPAVFLIRGREPGSEPYVSKTANLRRRLLRLLGAGEEGSRRLNLRQRAHTIAYTLTGSDFESGLLLYKLLRATFPNSYARRLRLRFAPLIKLHLDNPYPRASITTRLGKRGRALYYGPFPSRAMAEKFANDSLDFFKMRRCVEDLHPDPKFPGCIYSEMKMCLAPCFQGCTDEDYYAEVARVQSYFESGGQSLERELAEQREQASARLDFEAAAVLHGRLEKLAPVLSQVPDIICRIDRLAGVIIQRSAEPDAVSLFRIDGGLITGPVAFPIQQQMSGPGGKPLSMEWRVQECLAGVPPRDSASALETMEHLAILKRWYYRSSRSGEAFLADEKGALPLRRIVRGIARVFRGEQPVAENVSPGMAGTSTNGAMQHEPG